jgi:hypothetical protein
MSRRSGRFPVKRLVIWASVIVALLAEAAWAQDSPETWQGTLHARQDLRLVLQVTKADGALKGRLFSIDQEPGGMGTTTMSLDGGMLKFTILGMDVSYEGKVSPDGKMAVGTWKQGSQELPLTLERVSAEAAWEIPKATPALSPMDPKLEPGYEVRDD